MSGVVNQNRNDRCRNLWVRNTEHNFNWCRSLRAPSVIFEHLVPNWLIDIHFLGTQTKLQAESW